MNNYIVAISTNMASMIFVVYMVTGCIQSRADNPNVVPDDEFILVATGNYYGGAIKQLRYEDVGEIMRHCRAVSAAAPVIAVHGKVTFKDREWIPYMIVGTNPDFLKVRDWQTREPGKCFSENDVRVGNRVCVLGSRVADALFRTESPIAQQVEIRGLPFRVVAVLENNGRDWMGRDQNDVVVVPWTTIRTEVRPDDPDLLNSIVAKPTSIGESRRAVLEITELLRRRHGLQQSDENDFRVLEVRKSE
jgi:putative ABC transport system permease protein